MKFFWPLYLTSLIVGTAGVYVGAPYARPYVAIFFPSRQAQQADSPSATLFVPGPVAEPVADTPPARSTQEGEAENPPALLGIFPASPRDNPNWGVTVKLATAYALDGVRIGSLPGGTLFDCGTTRRSSKGEMVECRLLDAKLVKGPCLISRKEVCLFTESHAKLSPRQRAALQSYYRLSGQIGARKAELLQASAASNPFFAEANAAYRAFNENTEKAKALALRRNAVTDDEKNRLEDELRACKVEEVRLRAELDAANEKFREWKERNAQESVKPESDALIQSWKEEMAALRQVVPGLAL